MDLLPTQMNFHSNTLHLMNHNRQPAIFSRCWPCVLSHSAIYVIFPKYDNIAADILTIWTLPYLRISTIVSAEVLPLKGVLNPPDQVCDYFFLHFSQNYYTLVTSKICCCCCLFACLFVFFKENTRSSKIKNKVQRCSTSLI